MLESILYLKGLSKKNGFRAKKIIVTGLIMAVWIALPFSLLAQNQSSPANWLYPQGNLQGTRYISQKSVVSQSIDSFGVKWSTPLISGDVTPLIGNIVNNPKLFNYPFAPNEICAVMGDEIVVLSGTGSLIKKSKFPDFVKRVISISALVDTNQTDFSSHSQNPLTLALETIEAQDPKDIDSSAYSYLFTYVNAKDTLLPIKRFAVDLRDYAPNLFANVTPVFGKKYNGKLLVYATVNMSQPLVNDPNSANPPFFRGLAQFYDQENVSSFPFPDIGDTKDARVHLAPEVNIGQPSISDFEGSDATILLPTYPTLKFNDKSTDPPPVTDPFGITSILQDGFSVDTYTNESYLIDFKLQGDQVNSGFVPSFYSSDGISRPLVRSYFVDINDNFTGVENFILTTEEYSGLDGGEYTSKLSLYDTDGNPLTDDLVLFDTSPVFKGGKNHYWSIAVGDLDGDPANTWGKFYPNNLGKEIIATQSSRDFTYPGSRLYVLRYNSIEPQIEKPQQNGSYLFKFDTICTARINGWVAAVNDLDNSADGKDEIILVDGAKLVIIRMRDYSDLRFRLGSPFDTVYTRTFFGQTIQQAEVADLEGDGKNEVIITTNDSTYVIGSIIPNTLSVTAPKSASDYMKNYCVGDSVEIDWVNIIHGQAKVNLRFIETSGGVPIPGADTLYAAKGVDNIKDTVKFKFVPGIKFIGKEGKIKVEGEENPSMLYDTTTVVKFSGPVFNFDDLATKEFFANSNFNITGSSLCADSLKLEYTLDDSVWVEFFADSLLRGTNFNLEGTMPCTPEKFNCDTLKNDTILTIRIAAYSGGVINYSDTTGITFKPAHLPVYLDTATTANPAKKFTWNPSDTIFSNFGCDQIGFYYYLSSKDSLIFIESVPLSAGKFTWQVPVDIPDQVLVRLCCPNTCMRTDTILTPVTPKYLKIIAPNPFKAGFESLSIVYMVNEETNVNIRIYDQANHVVAEPVKDALRNPGIAYGDDWDGRRLDGSPVSNGLYYVSLEFSNGIREIYPLYVVK